MRIIIDQGGITPESDVGLGYTDLKNLSFAPQAGILGQSAPVTEFVGDIVTDDDIEPGDYTRLRDDMETLWAQYWLTSARRIDKKTVRVTGRSALMLLDRPRMPATFYTGVTVATLVSGIFEAIGYNPASSYYTLDAAVGARTLTGFCPEQTARERLQWVCFAAGAYIRTWFCGDVQILPVPDASGTPTVIPLDKTFMRPRITEGDHVTAVTARAYSFTQREPQSGEQYVTDHGGMTYVYTTQDITINNPDLQPAEFPLNTVDAMDDMLLDATRASAAASALARYCFNGVTVEADVIDNGGEYIPGMLVAVPVSEDKMYAGYITAATFRFGVQSRATLTIAGAQQVPCVGLTVTAMCSGEVLGVRRYVFPVGYDYYLVNDWLDITRDGVRRVFRPLTEAVQGTMPAGGATAVVQYAAALILEDGVLDVISVDDVSDMPVITVRKARVPSGDYAFGNFSALQGNALTGNVELKEIDTVPLTYVGRHDDDPMDFNRIYYLVGEYRCGALHAINASYSYTASIYDSVNRQKKYAFFPIKSREGVVWLTGFTLTAEQPGASYSRATSDVALCMSDKPFETWKANGYDDYGENYYPLIQAPNANCGIIDGAAAAPYTKEHSGKKVYFKWHGRQPIGDFNLLPMAHVEGKDQVTDLSAIVGDVAWFLLFGGYMEEMEFEDIGGGI